MIQRTGNGAALGDGMLITASVRARLLGFQLLKVEADVSVAPTAFRERKHPPRVGDRDSSRVANGNGVPVGAGLEAAIRSLESASTELTSARRRMP